MKSSRDLLFGKPIELSFVQKELEFKLDPDHFLKWLETDEWTMGHDYASSVSSACEYSCLYIGMLTYNMNLKNPLKIYRGNLGFFEHYWIGCVIDGQEYFIDLTLQQFNRSAPRLAITKAMNEEVPGGYSHSSDGYDLNDYVREKKGFKFYTNPHTMVKPKMPNIITDMTPVIDISKYLDIEL